MQRVQELETFIRDKQLIKIEISLEYFHSESKNQKQLLVLIFLDSKGEEKQLKLFNNFEVQFADLNCTSEYISHLKCFKDVNYIISLDPYDERTDHISDKDNLIFEFDEYKIV